jgi:hypothetical protein
MPAPGNESIEKLETLSGFKDRSFRKIHMAFCIKFLLSIWLAFISLGANSGKLEPVLNAKIDQ